MTIKQNVLSLSAEGLKPSEILVKLNESGVKTSIGTIRTYITKEKCKGLK